MGVGCEGESIKDNSKVSSLGDWMDANTSQRIRRVQGSGDTMRLVLTKAA